MMKILLGGLIASIMGCSKGHNGVLIGALKRVKIRDLIGVLMGYSK